MVYNIPALWIREHGKVQDGGGVFTKDMCKKRCIATSKALSECETSRFGQER